MNRHKAEAASKTRLAEIQANIDRHDLPDHTWAEELFRLDNGNGAWTQAFQIIKGRVYPITDVTFVTFPFTVTTTSEA